MAWAESELRNSYSSRYAHAIHYIFSNTTLEKIYCNNPHSISDLIDDSFFCDFFLRKFKS